MSRVIESILIPTDDSAGAFAAAKLGIALASRMGADVHILSVVELREELAEFEDEEPVSRFEADAEEAVEAVAELATDYDEDLQVTTAVKRGTPFQAIREHATRREIEVIAMGTKGQTGLSRVLLGSVAENVLRTARKPVLVVPPSAGVASIDDATFDRLLLPTDGSHGAEIATEWGVALATRLESPLQALYALDPGPFSGPFESERVLDALEAKGEDALDAIRERGEEAGVEVSGSIKTGSPANAILETATDADLIVMGTHGRTGIGQWFLGSVTENVVRQSDVPVFCVPVSAEPP